MKKKTNVSKKKITKKEIRQFDEDSQNTYNKLAVLLLKHFSPKSVHDILVLHSSLINLLCQNVKSIFYNLTEHKREAFIRQTFFAIIDNLKDDERYGTST